MKKEEKKLLDTKTVLRCSHCSKEFRYESERKRHEQSHIPQFECKTCSKSFSFISALRRHEKQHNRIGSVLCKECGGTFKDEILLKRHVKYAHKGIFMCSHCTGTFASEVALQTHSLTHQPASERKYRCTYRGCTKTFNFSHHLKNHELTHSKQKQHYCRHCGKGFIQLHHLKSHEKTHEPEELLVCGVGTCARTFATVYSRKRHVMSLHQDTSDAFAEKFSKDGSLCPNCGEYISKNQFTKHAMACVPIPRDISETNENLQNVDVAENLSMKPSKLHITEQKYNNNFDLENKSNSQPAITICQASGYPEVNDTFLCPKMTGDIEDYDRTIVEIPPPRDDTPIIDLSTKAGASQITKFGQSDVIVTLDIKDDFVATDCRICDCPGLRAIKPLKETYFKPCNNSVPSFECRGDGIVKLADTFDNSIKPLNNKMLSEGKKTDVVKGTMPFNSCKAVLGNCIVSGNDTISEGCLCARMSTESQHISEQEIDEIAIRSAFST